MELNEIRYFLAVAAELNFTRAAHACGVSQPALTRAIQKLESELGGALFWRRPRSVELTNLGCEVLPFCEALVGNLETVRQRAESFSKAGTQALRLGVMCTISPSRIIELLSAFKHRMPEVTISIVEATAGRVVEQVAADEIDIGIAAWPSYPDTVGAQRLFEESYVVAMHPDHPLAQGETVALESLSGCRYLERLSCEFDHYYQAKHGEWTVELDICFASEREDWIQALVLAEHGVAIVPASMVLHPGVVSRPLVEPVVTREISLITLRGRPLPPTAQSFLRIASRQFNANLVS